jgi:hypothetical protein
MSWVPLAEADEIDVTDAKPVLSDDQFQKIVERINTTFGPVHDAVE